MRINLERMFERKLIKIPRLFWEDCFFCDCNPPVAVKITKSHVWIVVDESLVNLTSRAELYADPQSGYWDSCRGLVLSARATLKAIKKGRALK